MMAATVLWLLRLAGPARRGRAMGHIGLANYAGLTVGPPLSQAIMGQSHPTRVWIASAILPLLGAALAFVMARGKDEAAHAIASDEDAERAVEEQNGGKQNGGKQNGADSAFRVTFRPGLGLMLSTSATSRSCPSGRPRRPSRRAESRRS